MMKLRVQKLRRRARQLDPEVFFGQIRGAKAAICAQPAFGNRQDSARRRRRYLHFAIPPTRARIQQQRTDTLVASSQDSSLQTCRRCTLFHVRLNRGIEHRLGSPHDRLRKQDGSIKIAALGQECTRTADSRSQGASCSTALLHPPSSRSIIVASAAATKTMACGNPGRRSTPGPTCTTSIATTER